MAPDLDGSGVSEVDTGETVPVFEEQVPVSAATRLRVLTFAAVGSLLTGYTAVASLLALVTAMASNASFVTTGVLTAAIPGWLAAYQTPVAIFGLEFGVLPLLPTIGIVAITAKAASGAAARLGLRTPAEARSVVFTIAATHGFAGLVVATITVDGVVTADPMTAGWYTAAMSGAAATFGVARRCGLFAAVRDRADAAAVAGLRAGAVAVLLLLVAGGLVMTFGLATSVSAAREQFPAGDGNMLGMLLLCIGYLPNGLIAGVAFVAGPGFSLGNIAVAPMALDPGPLPDLPLLAALPERQAAWWLLMFALPMAVGGVVGRLLRGVDEDPVARLRAVAVATGVVAVSFTLLCGLAGGHLGHGPLDPVSMRPVATSVALVLWTGLPAAIVAWFAGVRPVSEHLPGLIDDDDYDAHHDEDHDEDPYDHEEHTEEPDEPDAEATDADDASDEETGAEDEAADDAEDDEDGAGDDEESAHEVPGPREAVEESGEVARD